MATTRAERALATRRRMVKAAYDQFCAQGYAGATVASIAQAAGVAVPTIYYTFGTKAALLAEALGAAVLGFDRLARAAARPGDRRAAALARLVGGLPGGAYLRRRSGDLPRERREDPPAGRRTLADASGRWQRPRSGRGGAGGRAASTGGLPRSSARGRRDAGGPAGGADALPGPLDILMVLFSSDVYQALRAGRGWSAARCTEFLVELVKGQLLGPPIDGPEHLGSQVGTT